MAKLFHPCNLTVVLLLLRITANAINQAFTSVRESSGLRHIWLHDFKKKAGSDGKDLGNKTQAMRDLYDLRLAVKSPTK